MLLPCDVRNAILCRLSGKSLSLAAWLSTSLLAGKKASLLWSCHLINHSNELLISVLVFHIFGKTSSVFDTHHGEEETETSEAH